MNLIIGFNDRDTTTHEVLMDVLYTTYENVSGEKHPYQCGSVPAKPTLEPEVLRSIATRVKHLALTAIALFLVLPG